MAEPGGDADSPALVIGAPHSAGRPSRSISSGQRTDLTLIGD
jgi:hypothetical protein